jgi:uncharacterized membrane protein YkoI
LLALGSQSSVEASGSTPVGTRCYADWSQAAPIVRRESLVATAELHQHARTRKLGDLVRITLCEEGGRYVYRLVVLEPTNRTLTQHVVDARQPF